MRLPRPRPEHVALVALLTLLVGGTLLLQGAPGGGTPEGEVPSTDNAGSGGLRALLLACEDLGIPAAPFRGKLPSLDPSLPALAVVGGAVDREDAAAVARWVRGGGRLLLASRNDDGTLLSAFGLRTVAVDPRGPSLAGEAAAWATGDPLPEVVRAFVPGSLPPGARTLAAVATGDGARPWIVVFPCGAGEVTAVADGAFLTNGELGRPAAAVLAVRLVERTGRGASVGFAEDVHGHGTPDDMMRAFADLLGRTPAGRAALGAAAFGLLWLLAGARRFGRVRAVLDPPRRSENEYVEALGGLLLHNRAWRPAGSLLLAGVRRRLRPAAPPGEEASPEALAAEIAWGRPGEEAGIAAALGTLGAGEGPESLAPALAVVDRAMGSDRSRLRAPGDLRRPGKESHGSR